MAATTTAEEGSKAMSERFLTLDEVRKLFGVSRSTIWRWHSERGLKVVRVGNVTRIRSSDLQVFLSRHESSGAEGEAPAAQSP